MEQYSGAPLYRTPAERVEPPQAGSPRWALPLFLTRRTKYLAGGTAAVVTVALYVASNRLHLLTPRQLPMWRIDEGTPFVPWTVWIYLSEYLFFGTALVCCREMTNFNRFLYSFIALQLVSSAIFMVWPTTYPRDLFPLDPARMDAATYYVFASLRNADSPASCCPSLHVSSVFLAAFGYLDEQRGKFPFFALWGCAIAVSTLTTKQHFVIDVVTGFAMAVFFYWVFQTLVPYRRATGA